MLKHKLAKDYWRERFSKSEVKKINAAFHDASPAMPGFKIPDMKKCEDLNKVFDTYGHFAHPERDIADNTLGIEPRTIDRFLTKCEEALEEETPSRKGVFSALESESREDLKYEMLTTSLFLLTAHVNTKIKSNDPEVLDYDKVVDWDSEFREALLEANLIIPNTVEKYDLEGLKSLWKKELPFVAETAMKVAIMISEVSQKTVFTSVDSMKLLIYAREFHKGSESLPESIEDKHLHTSWFSL